MATNEQLIHDVTCIFYDGKFILGDLPDPMPEVFTVRFTTPEVFTQGNKIVVGGREMFLRTPNGINASSAMFRAGVVFHCDIDLGKGYAYAWSNQYASGSGSDTTPRRRLLDAYTNIFVNKNGDDSNDGYTNDNAFATIQRAISELRGIDGGGYTVRVLIGEGDWEVDSTITIEAGMTVGMDRLIFSGSGKESTRIHGADVHIFRISGTSVPVYFQNFGIDGGSHQIRCNQGTIAFIGNIDFGAVGTSHIVGYGAHISMSSDYSISGGWDGKQHIFLSQGGQLYLMGLEVTLKNEPVLTFLTVTRGSYARVTDSEFNGENHGRKFLVGPLSCIETNRGIEHLPGAIAGSVNSNGGFYV